MRAGKRSRVGSRRRRIVVGTAGWPMQLDWMSRFGEGERGRGMR